VKRKVCADKCFLLTYPISAAALSIREGFGGFERSAAGVLGSRFQPISERNRTPCVGTAHRTDSNAVVRFASSHLPDPFRTLATLLKSGMAIANVRSVLPFLCDLRSLAMSISQLLTRKPVTARLNDTLALVARTMKKENVGAVVIAQDDRPVGLVTDRDLALAVCSGECTPNDPVRNVMTCPVETIADDNGIYRAAQRMMELAVRRLPVVDKKGALVGLISLDDLLQLISHELQYMAEGVRAETALV
jgi:CBS domain-containing protein